jgi:hypothetical protein
MTGLDGFPRVLQFTPGPPVFPGSSSLLRVQNFSPGPPVSSNNKTDRHDIAEILLKVTLNITNQPNQTNPFLIFFFYFSSLPILVQITIKHKQSLLIY